MWSLRVADKTPVSARKKQIDDARSSITTVNTARQM